MKFSCLKVMDTTAFTLSQENNLPIKVFNMNIKGNLAKICKGENVGTLVNLEESIVGGNYLVNLSVDCDFKVAAIEDGKQIQLCSQV